MTAVNPEPRPPDTGSAEIGRLLARSEPEQAAAGYAHTLREILQQPSTWTVTAQALVRTIADGALRGAFEPRPGGVVLTGSGSSHYVGEALALGLQAALRLPVQAVPAGTLLTHWRGALPPGALLVSFARSGDSPESSGVVDALLAGAPDCRHLVVTCNARGRLATRYADDPRVTALVLDERTNDRSLVMTSSFTNLLLAGRALAWQAKPEALIERATRLAAIATRLLGDHADALAAIARRDFQSVACLGSGVRFGAAREVALKMLEMTSGRVRTLSETFLGLRHGPMSALDDATLVVGFLSCDPAVRAYECDLLRELARKRLGGLRVLVGEDIPTDLVADGDVAVELPSLAALGDEEAPLLDVVVGQLLALIRCLHLGFKPDAPAEGVLSRVVEEFAIQGWPA